MENRKLNIAFLHDWTMPLNEYFDNEDGLPRAISVLAELGHTVRWYTGGESSLTLPFRGCTLTTVPTAEQLAAHLAAQSPDVILCWGSLDRPWHQLVHERFPGTPKVLCFAGGPRHHIARSYFRVIVCESQVYVDDFTKAGVTAVRGFGTNMQVFAPETRNPKKWDAIYPASLCFHKNIELFARALPGRSLCVGNHNEPTIASKVLSLDTSLLHRVSSRVLADLYNMSRVTVITCGSDGGAQRVVLESMACGIPVVVMNDNDRCVEFVEKSGFGRVCHPVDVEIRDAVNDLLEWPLDFHVGVDYIAANWSEHHYAKALVDACLKAMLN